ncbi:MAG TPA: hypothetical protein VK184_25510, partial [Nostocaceae cyanobacterium]|nr:hypothetical protein [Nostocaceae cyanobacterium]
GNHIFNTNFNFHIHLHSGAGAYVCGEETALIESIEGAGGRRQEAGGQGGRGERVINYSSFLTFDF